jgi:GTP-binding protein EngB required for normal cell division
VNRKIRVAIAVTLLLFAMLAVLLLTVSLGSLVEFWQQLRELPVWIMALYLSLVLLIFGTTLAVLWWLFRPSGSKSLPAVKPEAPDEVSLEALLAEAREQGIETAGIEEELANLHRRREAGEIHIAVFGEISSGKSSLIRALLPGQEITTAVTGGTTRQLEHYRWTSPAGDGLVLVDMPGLNEADGSLDRLSAEEAQRSHIVLFVTDGDLTRSQLAAIGALRELGKPMVVALNKADWYDSDAIAHLRRSLAEKLEGIPVVVVQSGGEQVLVRQLPDGSEEQHVRRTPPEVDDLLRELQSVIDSRRDVLENLRDASVFVLAQRKLEAAVDAERSRRAREIVSDYSRKAVIGGLAAISPGSDLVIQGVLGTRMVRALSDLYDVPVRQADTDLLIELVQKHVGTTKTLTLAIAGNGLKAFPGVGTLAGGVLHAIAYGMIFNTLGKAVAESLRSRGELRPLVASQLFKEQFGVNLESSARRYAKVALEQLKEESR